MHFDADSYRELGRRYAKAYLQLLPTQDMPLRMERRVLVQGFDQKTCWVHARAGAVPQGDGPARMVMTMQPLLLSGSDVFYALHQLSFPQDKAPTEPPRRLATFARQVQADERAVHGIGTGIVDDDKLVTGTRNEAAELNEVERSGCMATE